MDTKPSATRERERERETERRESQRERERKERGERHTAREDLPCCPLSAFQWRP